jgi:hypothetical protein
MRVKKTWDLTLCGNNHVFFLRISTGSVAKFSKYLNTPFPMFNYAANE